MVYVLSKSGKAIMPCSNGKAAKLLRLGKAVVVSRKPFVIRMLYGCSGYIQKVTLGIDTGYKNIGFSAISGKKELISGELELDGKTSARLKERTMYRRGRRNKLWYREPRFNNRTRKDGWLPPSVQRRYDTHIGIVNRIKRLLPVCNVIVEVASFDIQKINNPDIQGEEYQQGNLYNYENKKAFLFVRENGKCQYCKKPFSKGKGARIHHCKHRKDEGADRPENLALLHEKCHKIVHKKNIKFKPGKSFKPNTFMSIIHKRFFGDILNLTRTFGYITKLKRLELGIEKSHMNDAFIIAGGNSQSRSASYMVKQARRCNRAIQLNREGFKPAIRKCKYKFQPMDLVRYKGKEYFVGGVHNKGKYIQLKNGSKPLEANINNVRLIKYANGLIFK